MITALAAQAPRAVGANKRFSPPLRASVSRPGCVDRRSVPCDRACVGDLGAASSKRVPMRMPKKLVDCTGMLDLVEAAADPSHTQ